MSSPDGPNGFAIVDKEPGWTSHDVVARARKLLNTRKVAFGPWFFRFRGVLIDNGEMKRLHVQMLQNFGGDFALMGDGLFGQGHNRADALAAQILQIT